MAASLFAAAIIKSSTTTPSASPPLKKSKENFGFNQNMTSDYIFDLCLNQIHTEIREPLKCYMCGKDPKMHKACCGRCGTVFCSAECLTASWMPGAIHRMYCNRLSTVLQMRRDIYSRIFKKMATSPISDSVKSEEKKVDSVNADPETYIGMLKKGARKAKSLSDSEDDDDDEDEEEDQIIDIEDKENTEPGAVEYQPERKRGRNDPLQQFRENEEDEESYATAPGELDDEIAEMTQMFGNLGVIQQEMGTTVESNAKILERTTVIFNMVLSEVPSYQSNASPPRMGSHLTELSKCIPFEQFKHDFIVPLIEYATQKDDRRWLTEVLKNVKYNNAVPVKLYGAGAITKLKESVDTTVGILRMMNLVDCTIDFHDATTELSGEFKEVMRGAMVSLLSTLSEDNHLRKVLFSDINFSRVFMPINPDMIPSNYIINQVFNITFSGCSNVRYVIPHFKHIKTLILDNSIYLDGPEITSSDFSNLVQENRDISALEIIMTKIPRPYRVALYLIYEICINPNPWIHGFLRSVTLCDATVTQKEAEERYGAIKQIYKTMDEMPDGIARIGFKSLRFVNLSKELIPTGIEDDTLLLNDNADGEIAKLALRVFAPRELRLPLPQISSAMEVWEFSDQLTVLKFKWDSVKNPPTLKHHADLTDRLVTQLLDSSQILMNMSELRIPMIHNSAAWTMLNKMIQLEKLHVYAIRPNSECVPLSPILSRVRISIIPNLAFAIAQFGSAMKIDIGTCDVNIDDLPKYKNENVTQKPALLLPPSIAIEVYQQTIRVLSIAFNIRRITMSSSLDRKLMTLLHTDSSGKASEPDMVTLHSIGSEPTSRYSVHFLHNFQSLQSAFPRLHMLRLLFGNTLQIGLPIPTNQSEVNDILIGTKIDRVGAKNVDLAGIGGSAITWAIITCRANCHLTFSDLIPTGPLEQPLELTDLIFAMPREKDRKISCRAGTLTMMVSDGIRIATLFAKISRGNLHTIILILDETDLMDDTQLGIVAGMFILLFENDPILNRVPLEFKLGHVNEPTKIIPRGFLEHAMTLEKLPRKYLGFKKLLQTRLQTIF